MKCNLIPPAFTSQRRETFQQRILLLAIAVFGTGVLCTGSAAFWWYLETCAVKSYVTDLVYTTNKKLKQHNQEERQANTLYEQIRAAQEKNTHWPGLLVVLADTKPAGITVQEVRGTGKSSIITAQTSTLDEAKAWQQALRHQGMIEKVQLRTVKQKPNMPKEILIEITTGNAYEKRTEKTP